MSSFLNSNSTSMVNNFRINNKVKYSAADFLEELEATAFHDVIVMLELRGTKYTDVMKTTLKIGENSFVFPTRSEFG